MSIKAFGVTVLVILLGGIQSMAQSTGKIVGKVVDKKTGEALIGATVLIEGSTTATATDMDGKFELKVAPGTYSVVFSYVSFQKKVVPGVVVKAGEVTTLNAGMEDASKELKTVVVEAEVRKENAAALLLEQKKSATISDGVSADLIKKTPDATTSDVMKRVSGASIQDNKFAIIRGLNDRYNTAFINGAPLPSSESDRKAFSFDIFPSNMLDNMVITKAATPDLPGDFAGGLITINTKDIPESRFVSLSLGASMHSITTGKQGLGYEGSNKDWLATGNKDRGVPDGIPARLQYEQSSLSEKYKSSLKFNDNWKTNTIGSLPLNNSFQLSGGNNYKVGKNNQAGFILSGSYSRSFRNTIVERNRFNRPMGVEENQYISSYTDSVTKEEVLMGLMANIGFKLGANHKFSFKNALTLNGEDNTIRRTGDDNYTDPDNPKVRNTYYNYQQSRLLTNQLIGQHFIPAIKMKVKWVLNNNNIKRDVPDFRRFSTRATLIDISTGEYSPYAAQIGPNIDVTQTGRFYSTLDESIRSASYDFQMPLPALSGKKVKTEVKAGGFHQVRKRDFQARVFGYKLRQIVNPGSPYNYQKYIQLPLEDIFSKDRLAEDTLYIDERINPQDVYSASSRLHAAYAMFDQRILTRIRAVYGVRMESYNQRLNSLGQTGQPVQVDTTFVDWLPSLNLTYELTEKINLRLSGNKSLARPEFRELAPFAFYDFNLNTVVAGSPNLNRTRINNYDFRFEYYPGAGQLISASVFYKKFKNAIESVYEFVGSDATLGYTSNANAENYGIELELRKNFDFLDKAFKTKWLNKFSVTCNYARIFSEVKLDKSIALSQFGARPLQGQSPFILNSSLQFYDPKSNWSVAVFVNRVGRRIYIAREKNGLVPDLWENPRTVVDISVSKKMGKHFEVKAALGDILAQDLVFYQDNNGNKKFDDVTRAQRDATVTPGEKSKLDNAIFRYKMGYTVSLGLSYKF